MESRDAGNIPEAEIRAALALVLAAPDFETSQRNRRFLCHVVEETLAGRADRIKAYSIATLVFGRGADFDPMQDSIVRIEAGRMRRALDSYNLKHAGTAGVVISIPKGSYVPAFHRQGMPPDAATAPPPAVVPIPAPIPAPVLAPAAPLRHDGPHIMIEPFQHEDESPQLPMIARILTRQVIASLTGFTELFIYGLDLSRPPPRSRRQTSRCPEIDYRLSATLALSESLLIAEFLLIREPDGRCIWAQNLQRDLGPGADPAHIVGHCAAIAGSIARVIAQRDGLLDSQARSPETGAQDFAGYRKLLNFQDYWRTLDPRLFEPLRHDLEETILARPDLADAHACLSMLYSSAARFGYETGSSAMPPLERALHLAGKAIRLAPNSSRAYHARAIAEWLAGRPADSLATLETACALNPNDSELLAELGFHHAMQMGWEQALPLLDEAYLRNPLQAGQYRMGYFLWHFAHGRYEQALAETQAIDAPGIAQVHLAAAAALAGLGRNDEARARLAQAERITPGLPAHLQGNLAFRQLHPDLVAAIADAIDQIGAQIGPDGRHPPQRDDLRKC